MLVLESHASSTEAFAKTIILVTVWTFCCVPVPALRPVTSCCKKSVCFRLPRCAWPPAPNSVRWTWEWCADMADRWQASSSEPHELHPAEPLPGFHTPGGRSSLTHEQKCCSHVWRHSQPPWDCTHMVRMQSLFYALILILHSITVNRGVITLYLPVRLAHWRYLLIPNHMVPLSWALLIGSLQHLWNFSIAKKRFLVFVINFQFLLCLQVYWLVFWVHSREFNSGICSLCDC